MNKENKHDPSRYLEIFDTLKLNDVCERRTAYKPLYEFFQKLILEVGVELCELNRNSLKSFHLNARWENIKNCLYYVENPTIWNELIKEINNIRQKVEHNDYYDPKSNRLVYIRKKAPEFAEWILRVAKIYYRKSKNFTLKEAFFNILYRFIDEAEGIFKEYGNSPYIVHSESALVYFSEGLYQQIPQLVKELKVRLKEIRKLKDIERLDFEKLIQIIKIIFYFRGREELLLSYSICPKCGGKIKTTQEYISTPYDSEPEAVYYRLGCEKCDYEIYSEIINI